MIHTWNIKRRVGKLGINWNVRKFRQVKRKLKLKPEGKFPSETKPWNNFLTCHLVSGKCWGASKYLVAGCTTSSSECKELCDKSWGGIINADSLEFIKPALYCETGSTCHNLQLFKDLAIVITDSNHVYLLPIDNPKIEPVELPDVHVSTSSAKTSLNCSRHAHLDGSQLYLQTSNTLVMVDLSSVDINSLESTTKDLKPVVILGQTTADFYVTPKYVFGLADRKLYMVNKKKKQLVSTLDVTDDLSVVAGFDGIAFAGGDNGIHVFKTMSNRLEETFVLEVPEVGSQRRHLHAVSFKGMSLLLSIQESAFYGVALFAALGYKLHFLDKFKIENASSFRVLGSFYDPHRFRIVLCLESSHSVSLKLSLN